MAILREHLLENKPVSEVCGRHQLQPTVFYGWQKTVLRERRCRLRAEEQTHRGGQGSPGRRPSGETSQQERGHRRTHGGERAVKKGQWGTRNGSWVPHDTRDQVVDYVHPWTQRAELPAKRLLRWLGLCEGKFYDWKNRYGKANEHNGQIPRDGWLEDWEKQAILDFHRRAGTGKR